MTRWAAIAIPCTLAAATLAAVPPEVPPAQPAAADPNAASALPQGCKIPLGPEGYPADARKRGSSGVVTASFQLNAKGELDHVTLLAGANGPFAAAAQAILRAAHCPAPAEQTGTAPHYVIDIQFALLPCLTPATSAQAKGAVMICASRLK